MNAHAQCPLCSWVSRSWPDNVGREEAMRDWRAHKEVHTHFGPVFVTDDDLSDLPLATDIVGPL